MYTKICFLYCMCKYRDYRDFCTYYTIDALSNRVTHSSAFVYFSMFYIAAECCVTHVWPVLKSGFLFVLLITQTQRARSSLLPGAESVLPHPLLLQQTGVLQFDRAGNEAHLTALFHQTPDPPVIVVLLYSEQTGIRGQCSILYKYILPFDPCFLPWIY